MNDPAKTTAVDDARKRLGDCQYGHDWVDGKCNTCGVVDSVKRIAALEGKLERLPADWWVDSSLQTWFPLTAEELERTKAQLRQEREAHCKLGNEHALCDPIISSLRIDLTASRTWTLTRARIRELQAENEQVAQLQTTQYELTRQRDMHACNAVELMRQRDELSKENRELLGLDKEIEDKVTQLQTTTSQQAKVCDEIREIAMDYRSGEYSTPGGLEHMGDVWRLIAKWDKALADITQKPEEEAKP